MRSLRARELPIPWFLAAALAVAAPSSVSAQVPRLVSLDPSAMGINEFIELKMSQAYAPGLAACIIKNDKVVWAGGFGYRNIERGLPVTPDTPFMMASVSKTVTGTAMMQLEESGLFHLDDDVDAYLPYAVDNPSHPLTPITFRHLLTHVSGIKDNWGVMGSLYVQGDSPIALTYFLQEYLEPGGQWYHAGQNFYSWAPETSFGYSNIGFALVGALVEHTSAVPFDAYCNSAIFAPLGMTNTSWRMADFHPLDVAMPYGYQPTTGTFKPYGHYGYPDYPNGGLRTSVLDLAQFLLVHMNDGTYGGAQILAPATVAKMHTVQYPSLSSNQGLAFYYRYMGADILLGHGGGDSGVYTEMWFRPADDVGVCLFANGDVKYGPMGEVLERLFEEADAY